ncbi:MAG: [protein-PII] uridylyltransferase, partial [Alphaproteobacteria bacterium]
MIRIPEPRRIIDPRALVAEIAGIARVSGGFGEAGGGRAAVVALLRSALDAGRREIRRRFEGGAGGDVTVASGALLVDHLVRLLNGVARRYAYPLANPTAGERLALVALGGYGRRELAPQSDVDLLFLRAYKPNPHVEQVVEYVLYGLWDIGLKVGHAVRSVDECIRLARADHVIRTSLLERHFVCGDRRPHAELERRFSAEVMAGTELEFVEAKLLERDRRHERLGDSRYVVEPNLKDGKGGLRDLHTLYWIAKYLYRVEDMGELVKLGVLTEKEASRFAKAQNFLLTLRSYLHYLTDRPGDVLTFDVQPEIGRRMGYTDHAGTRGVERFMKHYFLTAKAVGDLTRIFCAAIEAEHRLAARAESVPIGRARLGRFEVEGGRLTVSRDDVFDEDPVDLVRLFHASLEHGLDIHPRALRLVTRSLRLVDSELRAEPEANRLFLEILTSPKGPESTLRRMNEAGVFGRFVPDFGRVVAQMQHDMYHVYTVDEHTIRAIGILSRIERGLLREDHPLASEIVHKVLSRRVLYLGLLLHDIAKGRGGDHSDIGARIGRKLGPRLGLSEEETESVAWLVEN